MCVFCDTLIEDEDLYRFIDDCIAYLDCEYLRLCKGETPWEVYERKRWMGNSRTAHCSVELKGAVFKDWLLANYQPDECVLVFGFDWTEEHRHKEAAKNWQPYNVVSPLCEPPYLAKQDTFDLIKDCGIKIPRLYKMGFTHNNCGGFCCKAGQAHFALLLEKMPDRYAKMEAAQEKLFRVVPTARPSIRKIVKGKTYYLSLKDFRKMIENGGEFDPFDVGGCGCFSDT